MLYKNHIFQYMGKIFCVEFQRVPLKFHTKHHTHTLNDVDFIHRWKFKSSYIFEPITVFEIKIKSMVWSKKDVTPLLMHQSYIFLSLTYRNDNAQWNIIKLWHVWLTVLFFSVLFLFLFFYYWFLSVWYPIYHYLRENISITHHLYTRTWYFHICRLWYWRFDTIYSYMQSVPADCLTSAAKVCCFWIWRCVYCITKFMTGLQQYQYSPLSSICKHLYNLDYQYSLAYLSISNLDDKRLSGTTE